MQPSASRSPGLALISQFNDQSDESSDSEETSSSDEDGESADGNEKEDPLGVHTTVGEAGGRALMDTQGGRVDTDGDGGSKDGRENVIEDVNVPDCGEKRRSHMH